MSEEASNNPPVSSEKRLNSEICSSTSSVSTDLGYFSVQNSALPAAETPTSSVFSTPRGDSSSAINEDKRNRNERKVFTFDQDDSSTSKEDLTPVTPETEMSFYQAHRGNVDPSQGDVARNDSCKRQSVLQGSNRPVMNRRTRCFSSSSSHPCTSTLNHPPEPSNLNQERNDRPGPSTRNATGTFRSSRSNSPLGFRGSKLESTRSQSRNSLESAYYSLAPEQTSQVMGMLDDTASIATTRMPGTSLQSSPVVIRRVDRRRWLDDAASVTYNNRHQSDEEDIDEMVDAIPDRQTQAAMFRRQSNIIGTRMLELRDSLSYDGIKEYLQKKNPYSIVRRESNQDAINEGGQTLPNEWNSAFNVSSSSSTVPPNSSVGSVPIDDPYELHASNVANSELCDVCYDNRYGPVQRPPFRTQAHREIVSREFARLMMLHEAEDPGEQRQTLRPTLELCHASVQVQAEEESLDQSSKLSSSSCATPETNSEQYSFRPINSTSPSTSIESKPSSPATMIESHSQTLPMTSSIQNSPTTSSSGCASWNSNFHQSSVDSSQVNSTPRIPSAMRMITRNPRSQLPSSTLLSPLEVSSTDSIQTSSVNSPRATRFQRFFVPIHHSNAPIAIPSNSTPQNPPRVATLSMGNQSSSNTHGFSLGDFSREVARIARERKETNPVRKPTWR